jgi:uncharacterized membrane protein
MGGQTITRAARAVVIGAGLVVLLGLVAVATHSGFGSTGTGHGTVSHTLVSYAMTVFLIIFVCLIPVAIYLRLVQIRENPEQRASSLRRNIRGFAGIAAAMVFAYFFHRIWPHVHLQRQTAPKIPQPPQLGKGKLKLAHASSSSSPSFEWSALWVALAIAVAVAGYFVYRVRTRTFAELEPLGLEQDVAASISDAIDDLEREPDARRAVIAAYARMEAVLGRHGLRRRVSETPIEYLRRVLTDMTAHGDAVSRLTSLFERAKFSTHEIDVSAKHEAIAALREIRDGMA